MGPLPFKVDYQLRQGTDWQVFPPPWLPGGNQAMNFAWSTALLSIYLLPVVAPFVTVATAPSASGSVYLDTAGNYSWGVFRAAFANVPAPVFQNVIGLVATQLYYELEITDPRNLDYLLQSGFLYLLAPS